MQKLGHKRSKKTGYFLFLIQVMVVSKQGKSCTTLVTKLSASYKRGSQRYTCAAIQYGRSSDISSSVLYPDTVGS